MLAHDVGAAMLEGYGTVERCSMYNLPTGNTWTARCGDVSIAGEAVQAKEGGAIGDAREVLTQDKSGQHCWCRMTSPYIGLYAYVGSSSGVSGICIMPCSTTVWNNLSGAELEAYLSALFSTKLPQAPCEIGISKLMVSTGYSFQLWAEKYTEPSLVVQYNDEKCYVNLAAGAGNLNVKFNGEIYHAVD